MKRKSLIGILAAGLCVGGLIAAPQDQPPAKGSPTADQSKNNAPDRELAQKIRQALMADKTLSASAHNAKVIVQNGKVTLKGPVTSEEEKQSVEQKATEAAGAGNVTNQLTVKAARKKTS